MICRLSRNPILLSLSPLTETPRTPLSETKFGGLVGPSSSLDWQSVDISSSLPDIVLFSLPSLLGLVWALLRRRWLIQHVISFSRLLIKFKSGSRKASTFISSTSSSVMASLASVTLSGGRRASAFILELSVKFIHHPATMEIKQFPTWNSTSGLREVHNFIGKYSAQFPVPPYVYLNIVWSLTKCVAWRLGSRTTRVELTPVCWWCTGVSTVQQCVHCVQSGSLPV